MAAAKHIVWFALAWVLPLLTGCGKSEETVEYTTSRVPVCIRPAAIPYTKGSAELPGTTLGTDNSYVMHVSAGTSDVPLFISGQLFSYISETGNWEASSDIGIPSPLFWPLGGATMDFLSVAGTPSALASLAPVWSVSAPAEGFTISSWDTRADQYDLLYAAANSQVSSSGGGVVSLNFRHALALLLFEIKVDDTDVADALGVSITDISFPGLLTSASLTVDNSRNTLVASWEFDPADPSSAVMPSGSGTVSPALSGRVDTCIGFGDPLNSTEFVQIGDGLLVPPQRSLNFVMHYRIGSHDYTYTFNDTHHNWAAGRSYLYSLTLQLNSAEALGRVFTNPVEYGYEEF